MKITAIAILITLIMPMAKDIQELNEGGLYVEGEIASNYTHTTMQRFYQSVKINNVNVSIYFNDPVNEGEYYRINYLPNSKFRIKAIRE